MMTKLGNRISGIRSGHDESGMTLVELLVALVILPLIIGAAAAVIIASDEHSSHAQAELSDSANAQITAANFVRDVQGASQLTTDQASANPTLCGTSFSGETAPAGSTLLLGLNRPSSLSIGYWESKVTSGTTTTYQIVRYSCSGSPSQVIVSDDVDNTAQGPAVITAPTALGNPATGWIPTSPVTKFSGASALSLTGAGDNIPVTSTAGFTTAQSITFLADIGTAPGSGPFVAESVTCTGMTSASFTGCSGGSGSIDPGTYVNQPNTVASVHLTVAEPASTYVFGLRGSPRVLAASTSGNTAVIPGNPVGGAGNGTSGSGSGGTGPSNGGPALLTLGSGVTIQGGTNSTLTVDGLIDVSAGTLGCTGHPTVQATGYEATGGSGAIGGCATGGSTTQLSSPTPDPLAPFVPHPFPNQATCYGTGTPNFSTASCSAMPSGTCPPGEYTQALPSGCNLQPGIYVLDRGYTATGGNSTLGCSTCSTSGGPGVLLYVPCTSTYCSGSMSLGGNALFALSPIDALQSQTAFGTTALAGVVYWQDSGNTSADTFGGTTGGGASIGTIYAPSAAITLQGNSTGTYGQIIAASVSMAGSTPMVVTGK